MDNADSLRTHVLRRLLAGAVAAAIGVVALPLVATAAPTPSVTISNVAVTEGTGAAVMASFTIKASPRPGNCCALQVNWATAPGTATSPADFTASSGTVTLNRANSQRVVNVPVIGDAIDEPTETFVVNLSNLTGSPGTIGDAQGVATITDNDNPPVLSIDDVSVAEGNVGNTTASFTASLSAPSSSQVTFAFATSVGTATAGTDYTAASGSKTIPAGSSSVPINIVVKGDTVDEPNETFGVTISAPVNATIGDGSGIGTITDDDPLPVVSVGDASLVEGDAGGSTMSFGVTLSHASAQTITVAWGTADDTAHQPGDYATGSGTVTFLPSDTSESVDVTIEGDTVDEFDETFTVGLSGPTNATIGDGTGVGTITDDDPLPSLAVGDASIPEGDAGTSQLTVDVTLSEASDKTVTVGWTTADQDAVAPGDYTADFGTLTFVPGDTTESISIDVLGDNVAELDEAFRIVLLSPNQATLGDDEGVGTIVDDELLPVIDIDEPSIAEGQVGSHPLTFSVTLSHPSAGTVTVDWTTAADTATDGVDYLGDNGTVTFDPLDTSETVEITVNGDGIYEVGETFSVELSNASGAPIGDVDSQGIGTILNDDDAPILSVSNASIAEGSTGTRMLTFTVSLVGDTEVAASAVYTVAAGTAAAGTDFVAGTDTVSIPDGEISALVTVAVKGDVKWEPNETLSLLLSDPTDATIGDGTGIGTIRNDDKAPTVVTLRVVRTPTSVIAKGRLEPTKPGHRVTATLFRKVNGTFVKIAAKTVQVRLIRDRDHDGKRDGVYRAVFGRPHAGGTYKMLVRFRGGPLFKPCRRARIFTLAAS
jgi:Calx-beta domain-containing protein